MEDPAVPLERTRAMVNLDMVGRLGSDTLIVYGTGTAVEWDSLVTRYAGTLDIEVAFNPEGYGPSDHTSFYARDIPVLHFFTNVHGDYHRPGDDWQKLDVRGMERIADLVCRVVREVADRPTPLTLVRGVGERPAPPGETAPGYGAYLGTIPDFAPVDRGVRLNGVTASSPADRAGLREGDIIIGLGGRPIDDLRGLADALSSHDPGDTVAVRILRGEEERELEAVLGRRGGGG